MGHRTLVAYDREPAADSETCRNGDTEGGHYDLHLAHWGVAPAELTPQTPFGGHVDAGWARRRASELLDPEGGRLVDDSDTAVDPDPVATGLSFTEVCNRVDPVVHEALLVVAPNFSVRSYLVFALRAAAGAADAGTDVDADTDADADDDSKDRVDDESHDGDGPVAALVGYDDALDAAYLRGWLTGARAVRDVGGLGDDGVVRALRWLDPDRGTLVYLVEA